MKLAIIGLGLIGSSIARALKDHATIIGINRSRSVIEAALHDGAISQGGGDLSLAKGCDMAVIALPVGNIVEVAFKLIPFLDKGTILTDTGSTKAEIVRSLTPVWPWFVGSHPIAGKENSGYQSGDAAIFKDAVNIITPIPITQKPCIKKVEDLWSLCGAKNFIMDPEEHDGIMAKTSHMPHLISFVFMSLLQDKIPSFLIAKGFKDFTRIAGADAIMWKDIFIANKHNILPLIDEYLEELSRIRTYLNEDRQEKLEEALSEYRQLRRSLYENKG